MASPYQYCRPQFACSNFFQHTDVLFMAEYTNRKRRLFERLCRPAYEKYCKTRCYSDFLEYQIIEGWISHMLRHKMCVARSIPHCFIRQSYDPRFVSVESF